MSVDFYAGYQGERSFELHTGAMPFGPAGAAMELLAEAVRNGQIAGEFGVELTADKVLGVVLKQVFAPMAGADRWPTPLSNNRPGFRNGDDLLEWIDEGATYSLAALEV